MKKSMLSTIFIIVCLIMCAVPVIGLLVFGPSQAGANEVLSAPPALHSTEGDINTSFLQDVSTYVSDHFYLRQELITCHNKLTAALLASSAEDDVILGSEGWLYYAPTLDDYTGADTMSARDIWSASHNLYLMQEYCLEHGADFLFAVAPNKNSLYGENMPDYGSVSLEHDAQRLFKEFDNTGLNYIDLFSLFGSEEEVLYFSHDSHWNSKGAALAADEINAAFGKGSAYYADSFSGTLSHSGDLFEMLYPVGTDSETDYVYGGEISLEYAGSGTRPDSITITALGSGEGTLLAYRDSFGNLLYPYLADSFSWSRFSRSTIYDLTQIDALEIDCVLIELVERNLDYLIKYTPLLPSPVRSAEVTENVSGTINVSADETARAPEGCVLVKGTIDLPIDDNSPVYVVCGGAAYDALLLEGRGFSAYVPAGAVPEYVLYYNSGVLVTCAVNN